MIEVVPLKYGPMFKRVFSQPTVFNQFAKDILGIDLNVSRVHTEYEYPEPVGFVRSRYDLFAEDVEQVRGFDEYGFDRTVYTIIVLTSLPRDGSINFSCAISDMSPVDEWGSKVPVYPHRLVFLSPRQVNENTPSTVRKWLDFIKDSLDGEVEESNYGEKLFQQMIEEIRKQTIDPELLSEIKDEAAWEKAKDRFAREGREVGQKEVVLAQQRQTVINAKQMGISVAAIATLVGLSETEVQEVLNHA
jgi:hypothetical protein